MDQFFLEFLLSLDELTEPLYWIALVAIGAVATALFVNVRIRLNRIAYLWWITFLTAALTANLALWLLLPQAADVGLFSALPILDLVNYLLFGALYYYGSAARSRDIAGGTHLAWLGFVPILNLELLLRPGAGADGAPARSGVRRFLIDPLLAISGVAVVVFTMIFAGRLAEHIDTEVVTDPAVEALFTGLRTPEMRFRREAAHTGRELPAPLGDNLIYKSIRAHGDVLQMTFEIVKGVPDFGPVFERRLAETYCPQQAYGPEFAQGGRVFVVYTAPDGRIVREFEVNQAACDALRAPGAAGPSGM